MGSREARDRHDALLRELNQERIAALSRISRTLESLIDQLNDLRRQFTLDLLNASDHRGRYETLRRKATEYRWFLEVQREALGIRQHAALDEFYRVPGPLQSIDRTERQAISSTSDGVAGPDVVTN